MIFGVILEKLIYVGILVAIFVVFKRASKQTLKSVYWALTAGITLFLSTLFSSFTSTNGQLLLKRVTGIAPSESSEILFGILSIIILILWLILFVINLKKHKHADLENT